MLIAAVVALLTIYLMHKHPIFVRVIVVGVLSAGMVYVGWHLHTIDMSKYVVWPTIGIGIVGLINASVDLIDAVIDRVSRLRSHA